MYSYAFLEDIHLWNITIVDAIVYSLNKIPLASHIAFWEKWLAESTPEPLSHSAQRFVFLNTSATTSKTMS